MQQNGVEPCGKPATLIVAIQAFPSFDQGFGNQVLGRAQIARQRDGLPQEAGLERRGHKAKRRRIPGACAPEKFAGGGCFSPVVGEEHHTINPRGAGKGSSFNVPKHFEWHAFQRFFPARGESAAVKQGKPAAVIDRRYRGPPKKMFEHFWAILSNFRWLFRWLFGLAFERSGW
jgi:hypothetical protein